MRLFKNKARYPDFDNAYELYVKRSERANETLSKGAFIDIVRRYCSRLADRLENEGIVDLPFDIGSLCAVRIEKAPRFNRTTGKYMPADNIDWDSTRSTGEITRGTDNITFGICFSPRRVRRMENFRAFGIVANKRLYRRMKKSFDEGTTNYYVPDIETYL